MAKINFDMGGFDEKLAKLGSRESLRAILEAGSKAAVDQLKERTQEKRHVVTGEMMGAINAGPVHEDLGKAWQYVYPSGDGDHGQDLAKVAYVINYGRGGNPTRKKTQNKTGDHFLTGNKKTLEQAVGEAMRAEAERIQNEIMR